MPGMAASMSDTCEFGSPPNAVDAPENNLACEVTWACTSMPMTTSQSPVAPLISFDFGTGASIVASRCSGAVSVRASCARGKRRGDRITSPRARGPAPPGPGDRRSRTAPIVSRRRGDSASTAAPRRHRWGPMRAPDRRHRSCPHPPRRRRWCRRSIGKARRESLWVAHRVPSGAPGLRTETLTSARRLPFSMSPSQVPR